MYEMRSSVARLCVALMLSPLSGFAADTPAPQTDRPVVPQPVTTEPHGVLGKIEYPFKARPVPPPNVANTGRLDSLLRGGNLYLSMQDAIALTLENNLD